MLTDVVVNSGQSSLLLPLAFLGLAFQSLVIALLAVKLGRKRNETRLLRQAEGEARRMVASSPIGICVVSNRRFVYVNNAYVKMFGYEHGEEIVGRFVEELYAPEERPRQRRYAKDRPAGKPVPSSYDTKGLRKDGSHFAVAAWVSLFEYNGIPSSLGFVIDRSMEMELRCQLEKANRLEALGTFAGGIAHDFNNILTAVIGYTELALARVEEPAAVRADLNRVRQAGQRAKELVQQILTFSRAGEGTRKPFRVAEVVREVMGLVRASLPSSIEIRTVFEDDAVLYGDPGQMHQLLMNLCANAEYAMRGQVGILEIVITSQHLVGPLALRYPDIQPGEYICLTVSDSGPGIPPEIVDKIFEPFFTTKAVGEGSGMGLSQVHGIVRHHGGYVRVESNEPRGARFIMHFPKAQVAEWQEVLPGYELVGGNESILVLDDEEMVAGVLARLLSELGYRVTVCRKASKALEILSDDPEGFDLVISDYTMPEITGGRLAESIHALRSDLPIILCSGLHLSAGQLQTKCSGVKGFLEKPVGKTQLAERVRSILDECSVAEGHVTS